jgi:hypothetical protein
MNRQWQRPAGGFARRSALAVLAAAFLVGGGSAAFAKLPPTISLSPNSGTPGTVVTVRGKGFCDAAGCSAVSILFAGTPAADGIAVGRDGTFRGTFRVPGGGVVGQTNVTATQTEQDGYEIVAHATFDLVFGKGEEAEVQADINDIAAQPPGSPLPEKALRGVPLESAAASLRGEEPPPSPSPGASRPDSTVAAARRAAADWWWLLMLAGIPAALAIRYAVRSALKR